MFEPFQLPFLQYALMAGGLVALFCSVLGVQVVLRRMVFLSAGLTQIATAGMALGFLLGLQPLLTSVFLTLLSLWLLARLSQQRRPTTDSSLGLAYIAAFGLTILFIAKSGKGYEELQHLLQGDLLTVTWQQVQVLALLLVLLFTGYFLFHKEFSLIAFDPDMAETLGYNVPFWNFLFYALVGIAVASGIQAVGALLIFALLIIPAITGLALAGKMTLIYLIAMITGLFAVFSGLLLSFYLDLPASPTIVTILSLIAVCASLGKKRPNR